ncbi:uncharacterized protein RCC_04297 [Ramularia collo-cygni]|uniref:Uncharacterized protein n=1 Tax=Ramularia collo-cygni TaxID=112498 RepID=A0A2D3UPJ4_9PEZI|nr:uncharacterized protein RCC_04297 [Ramularia collo-cygni]CZT18452.1 uncharacterized protein RCC_04297 [Ramularia collo-cygni]
MPLLEFHNFRTGEKANQTAILKSLDDLPDKYLMSSSLALIAGGSDTTGFTFSYACWQLVQNPVLAARLREEVDALFEQAAPGYPSLTAMEASPLLYGFVKESLRCALAIPGRLPRIVPGDGRAPLVVDGKEIPSGSVVGMSAYTMHRDPEIWGPDVLEFNPDRWIGQPSRAKAADIVIFSKGIRNCAGEPLASAELHMGLAFLSRRYDMRLVAGPREWSSMDYFVTTGPHFYVKLTPREGVPIPSIS